MRNLAAALATAVAAFGILAPEAGATRDRRHCPPGTHNPNYCEQHHHHDHHERQRRPWWLWL
jgi:hypothetical protein